jgi:rare lipoprotein A
MKRTSKTFFVFAVAASLSTALQCAPALAADVASGRAALYSDKLHGKKTANGQKYDKHALTAASNRFPLGSMVQVTNKKNGKNVTVKIIDTEAKRNKDILDLSKAAATHLGMSTGRITVEAKVVGK